MTDFLMGLGATAVVLVFVTVVGLTIVLMANEAIDLYFDWKEKED